jgi:diguanylate cyclase (GGDEF)-like protein/PAS domain S-box-containing protein
MLKLDGKLILNELNQNIFVKDLHSNYLYVNATYTNLLGVTPAEIIGKNDFDFFPKHIAEKYRSDDAVVIAKKETIETKEEIVVEGQIRIIRTVKKPLYFEGEIFAVLGIFWDVTQYADQEIEYKKLQYGLNKAQALANIGHWELDFVSNELFWSDEVYRIFGLKPQSFGATYEAFLEHIHPDDIELVNKSYMDSVNEKKGYHITHRIIRSDGSVGFVEERCEHLFDDGMNIVRSIGTVHDITKTKEAEHGLVLAAEVFAKMHDGVLITDENQKIIQINQAFTNISGYELEDIKGKTPAMLSSGWHTNEFYQKMWEEINTKGKWAGEVRDRRKNGETYLAEMMIVALRNDAGTLTNYISINTDITDRKEKEELIHNLAYFDSLTQLPNRILFEERFHDKVSTLKRTQKKMAILFLDMDNFKHVNDTLGHVIGDKFLVQVALEIKKSLRESDTFARVGGDEFMIILDDLEDITQVLPTAQRIVKSFLNPVIVEGKELFTGVSIGISVYPDDSENYIELVKYADTAMYHVKESGKNDFQFYTESMNEKMTSRMKIQSNLRNAILNNEFFLEYQPKINLETHTVYGMEALIRWNHPTDGLIRPDIFIGIAEQTGQIYEIGLWVAAKAMQDTKDLQKDGKYLVVSINVSSVQLENEFFINDICKVAYDIGLDKSYIELEITESHIMNNIEKALVTLQELSSRGFKISIDDFGTGYSSLAYLKKLPAQTIKIDRSFVLDIDKDDDDRSIVGAIIAMARSLGKDVIAEGSETQEHIDTLKYLHCHKVQGYYFSRPIRIEKFKEFVENF